MSRVKLVRETYIKVSYGGSVYAIEVRTKDIGCTIGTELIWSRSGIRIAAYRPGTRYGDRAEECAAELVQEALSKLSPGLGMLGLFSELTEAIRSHEDVQGSPWGPDSEDEGDW